jgi:hypothetical protein
MSVVWKRALHHLSCLIIGWSENSLKIYLKSTPTQSIKRVTEWRRRPDFFELTILDFLSCLLPTLWDYGRSSDFWVTYLFSSSVTCSKSSELLVTYLVVWHVKNLCCFTHWSYLFPGPRLLLFGWKLTHSQMLGLDKTNFLLGLHKTDLTYSMLQINLEFDFHLANIIPSF